MIELKDLVSFLDKELQISTIKDICENSLQVQGKNKIINAGIAVDITMNTIAKAVENSCDIIISHHPLIKKPLKRITGITAKKLQFLMKNNISAYVAHFPIDAHKKYSHSLLIAEKCGLYGLSKFAKQDTNYFGFIGNLKKGMPLEQIKEMVDKCLKTDSKIFQYGKKENSAVAIVSGGGGSFIGQAEEAGIDCFITGDMAHHELMDAKDLKINVVLGGHYETEKLGMIKLSHSITKKFKIQCFFLES
jgi:dinuclear metal center YbgI/SA1388 family protein